MRYPLTIHFSFADLVAEELRRIQVSYRLYHTPHRLENQLPGFLSHSQSFR